VNVEPSDDERVATGDPLGTAAIVCGCVGIVVAGIAMAIVTAVLAAMAGASAKAQGRSLENGYLALLLSGVDGIFWLALHFMFDIPFLLG
jgi:hypothetical protein